VDQNVDLEHVLSLANDFESGEWRYGRFQNYIWDNIAETALPCFYMWLYASVSELLMA
jgi:hypothetical protein